VFLIARNSACFRSLHNFGATHRALKKFSRASAARRLLKNIFVEKFAACGVWQGKISEINTSAAEDRA
jgi:hypothetical protein